MTKEEKLERVRDLRVIDGLHEIFVNTTIDDSIDIVDLVNCNEMM